jgi:hypothetical protein
MTLLLLDSGISQYLIFLFFLNLVFGIVTAIIGFIGFIFLFVSLFLILSIGYLFRYEKRLASESFYVSPTDGKIIYVNNNLPNLPDIINKSFYEKSPYSLLMIKSDIQNTFFKISPCDGVIEDIIIMPPRTIKNSNFVHKSHKTHILINIAIDKDNEKKNLFLVFEVLYLDKDYDLYKLYVEKNQKISKNDVLICVHFYSIIYMYIPSDFIKNSVNQSLFYTETSLQCN